ncbi:Helicase associated domain protein [Streptomyces phaeochromogenes]
MAHRPRPIARELTAYRDAAQQPEKAADGRQLHLGLRHRSDQAFTTGLAHARAYAAVHGHLAAPIHSRFNGFTLGRWLSNHRKYPAMPPEHVAELEALDPWWRPPWTVMWQRFYYQARDHTRARGPLRPEHGFPTTGFGLGEWLYNQCTGYDSLHPGQQRLLADIGLTRESARAARPRRKHMATHFQHVLACAYADTHGTLVNATTDTVEDGLKLGQWLSNQRSKDRAHRIRHSTPSPRALALSAIAPWWNPPWTLEWQRSWHQARTHVQDGHVLDPAAGFPGTSSALATWLTTQCAQYDTLLPDQHGLLARIGITADQARSAAARPAESEADFATALGYARSYHAVHGTLAAAVDTVHDGFQLGRVAAPATPARPRPRPPRHTSIRPDEGPVGGRSLVVPALEPGVAARLAADPRPDQGRPPARRRPPLPQLRPGPTHLATHTTQPLRRPPPRPAAPPGRHRSDPRQRPHPAPHPLRRDRPRPRPRLRRHPPTPWPWPTPPSTTASPSAAGSTTNANKPDTTPPPTPATRP